MLRVPVDAGTAWFKACGPTQAFEPALTVGLSERWPDRVTQVLAHDVERAWLLLADAGAPIAAAGNAPEIWLEALPRYAELQRGEVAHAGEHLANDVPDLRLGILADRYELLFQRDLPIRPDEVELLRHFRSGFARLCDELAKDHPVDSIQHDDLHLWNLYTHGSDVRVIDWGDASVAHPFESLIVTFRFLEQVNGLPPTDPWFAKLRDAYLEPWGPGLVDTFDRAMRIGAFAHAIASIRIRDVLPEPARPAFDDDFATVLRRAINRIAA